MIDKEKGKKVGVLAKKMQRERSVERKTPDYPCGGIVGSKRLAERVKVLTLNP